MKRVIGLIVVVAATMTFPAGAGASHQYVFCGNFSGQGMSPHVARKPARCDVTEFDRGPATVDKLRHMRWPQWGERAVGHGLVNGREHRVRLQRARPCGQHGEFKVYSRMSIDSRPFRTIMHCGD